MISYEPLWITLIKKNMKKKDLYGFVGSATVARMGKGRYIDLEVLDRICKNLNCDITEVIKYVPDPQGEEKEKG